MKICSARALLALAVNLDRGKKKLRRFFLHENILFTFNNFFPVRLAYVQTSDSDCELPDMSFDFVPKYLEVLKAASKREANVHLDRKTWMVCAFFPDGTVKLVGMPVLEDENEPVPCNKVLHTHAAGILKLEEEAGRVRDFFNIAICQDNLSRILEIYRAATGRTRFNPNPLMFFPTGSRRPVLVRFSNEDFELTLGVPLVRVFTMPCITPKGRKSAVAGEKGE